MTLFDQRKFPHKFSDLIVSPPLGLRISERVLDPIILICKTHGAITPRLGGMRIVNGQEEIILTVENTFDWVLDGALARPLPSDIQYIFQNFIGSNSNWQKDLFNPTATHLDGIAIRVQDSILRPANFASDDFPADLNVPGLQAKLYPYQARGIAWMNETLKHFGGFILADEMGLGKTLQIIALLLLTPPTPSAPALVICPTSLIANWVREFDRFAPSISLLLHRGSERTGMFRGLQAADVVITTYDTMVNDISLFTAFEWSYIICDEAQAIKNPYSGRRLAITNIPRKYAIPISGTPVENSLTDLWSLADFSIPDILGSLESFKNNFPDSLESAVSLGKIIDPLILKRRVADVASDLPDRINIDIPIEMEEKLSDHYESVREATLNSYPIAGALVATIKLQLICAHPWLQLKGSGLTEFDDAEIAEISDFSLMTEKMEIAVGIICDAYRNGLKVLVFSIFNQLGELLRCAVSRTTAIWWDEINGNTPQTERQNIVDRFSAFDGPAVLILNPRAAGSGLNITAATVVVHMTPVWNPALEAQASARAHRRGQTRPVTVYRLFYENTVERIMLNRSAWKNHMGNEISPLASRDTEDLTRALEISPKAR